MQAVFQALDTDNSGQLSYQELLKGLTKTMGKEKAKEQVLKIFNVIDTDNNKNITYSEFVTASIDRCNFLTKERLQAAFKMFDTGNTGTINASELKDLLQAGHIEME